MSFKQVDPKFWQGEYLNFIDDGPSVVGGKTRKFRVHSRHNQALLGHVKWYNKWRQYVLFPLNAIFEKRCLREAADFCEMATTEHRNKK